LLIFVGAYTYQEVAGEKGLIKKYYIKLGVININIKQVNIFI